jgi:hypothetical protein
MMAVEALVSGLCVHRGATIRAAGRFPKPPFDAVIAKHVPAGRQAKRGLVDAFGAFHAKVIVADVAGWLEVQVSRALQRKVEKEGEGQSQDAYSSHSRVGLGYRRSLANAVSSARPPF